ncbi:MAG TPA: DUF4399 domain-containing protein [Polyangiales bacterium]|nr:DUF4399 domain-containing protein [Polyangiales bacterium]
MLNKTLRISFTASTLALLLACGEKPSEPAPAPAEPPAAPAAPVAAPSGLPEIPPVPEGAKVSFVEPADGAKIEGPLVDGKVKVTIKMGAEKIVVKPAGAPEAGTGHHHLLVDTEATAKGDVVGQDEKHIHFGKGQTETELMLAPGEHSLKLQFADGLHRSYGPQLGAQITVTVAEAKPEEAKPAAEEAKKGAKTKAAKTKK